MKVKETTVSVESIELEKTYLVMNLRQSYGYSAFELSFLLGRRDFYVRDAENPLHTLTYSVNENNYLRQVFNCSLKKIMPGKVEPIKYSLRIRHELNENGLPVYHIERGAPKSKFELFHSITEEHKEVELPVKGEVVPVNQVKEYMTKLVEKGYFGEPKTALFIFNDCKRSMSGVVRPLYVAYALGDFTGKRKAPRLIKETNESGRAVYREDMG